MNKDTVIGIGVGVLVGWLLWRRRRGLAALVGSGGGGCVGCSGGSANIGTAAGAAPNRCAQAVSAGLGNYNQSSGPVYPVY